jgi:hypothetical protein
VLALALSQDIKDPKLVHKLSLHKVEVQAVAFSCDGERQWMPHRSPELSASPCAFNAEPWRTQQRNQCQLCPVDAEVSLAAAKL